MDRKDAIELIKGFARLQPAYTGWREKMAVEAARISNSDPGHEWSEMVSSIARTLTTIEFKEGEAVLRRIEQGQIPIPPYGELALCILREAKQARQPENRHYDSQPTYRCLVCRDTGIAHVWNPHFVEAYRDEFAKVTRTPIERDAMRQATTGGPQRFQLDLDRLDPEGAVVVYDYQPPNWLHLARCWWRSQGESGIYYSALCNCDCSRRTALARELDDFENGSRRTVLGKQASAPACGRMRYEPERMPLKTSQPFDDLHNWYANHLVNSAYEWQP